MTASVPRHCRPWIVLSFALLLLAPNSSHAVIVGTNVNVSNQGGAQSETDIAIDPTNPSHLLGASDDLSSAFMRVYESFDAGATWTNNALPAPPAPYNSFVAYPSVAFDAAGNAFATYTGVNSAGNATTLVEARKPAGDIVWGGPIVIPNVNGFKGLTTADRTGGAFNNRAYVAWSNNNPTSLDIRLGRSTDGGATFSSIKVNDSGIAVFAADPAVGPDGEVYVAWIDYLNTAHNIMVDRSLDGGVSFGTDHLIHHWVASTGTGVFLQIPAHPIRGVGILPSIDVDRSNGPNRGAVYCVYNDVLPGSGFDIYLRKSTDGGVTWSAALRLNDDQIGVVRDQFMPRVAVDPFDGSINVVWYDARDDVNNKKTNLYYTRSTDGGATFEPNIVVTTARSDETLAGRDPNGYGEYLGIAAMNGTIHPLWTDSRTLPEEIYAAAIQAILVSVDGVSNPDRIDLSVPWLARAASPVEVRYHIGNGESPMRLDVYSVTGSLVRRLAEGMSTPGDHVAHWDLRGRAGQPVAHGIYFIELTVGNHALTRKLVAL